MLLILWFQMLLMVKWSHMKNLYSFDELSRHINTYIMRIFQATSKLLLNLAYIGFPSITLLLSNELSVLHNYFYKLFYFHQLLLFFKNFNYFTQISLWSSDTHILSNSRQHSHSIVSDEASKILPKSLRKSFKNS